MNPVIDALKHRLSTPARLLVEPAPDDAAIKTLIECALSAPDHAALRPFHFLIIRGEGRGKLADLLEAAALQRDPELSTSKREAVREKPFRAPLIIAAVAKIQPDNPKAPRDEQLLAAGAATQQLQLAAGALGFGSVWLTGPLATHPIVTSGLGLVATDELVGFIYLGTPKSAIPKRERPAVTEHLSEWAG